jgi:predicted Zn-dependent peptidase
VYRLLCICALLTLMGAGPVHANEPALSDSAQVSTQLQGTLPNGLRIVVQSVPWERLVDIEVVYNAGAVTDPDSLAGLAHFAEHLLTESGQQHPNGELVRLQSLYSTYRNAYTGSSSMTFVSQCLPEYLPELLDLEADRMRGAGTDSLSFEREKRVVLEELAYRHRLSPYMVFMEAIFRMSYPGHPYSRDVGGTPESVSQIGRDDYKNFKAERISPEKAVLVISGPVDPESTMESVREKFDSGPDAEPYLPRVPEYPPAAAGQVVLDSQDYTGLYTGFACRIPLEDDRDAALAYSMVEFLDESGLGLQQWSVPGEVVLFVYVTTKYFRPPTDLDGHYGMDYPEFDPDQDAHWALGHMWERLGETLNDLGNQEAFDEARQRVLAALGSQDETSGTGSGTGQALINGNRYLDPNTMAKILQEMTPADLHAFANQYIRPDRAVVGVGHGRDSGRSAPIDLAGRVAPGSAMSAQDNLNLLGRELIEPVIEAYRHADLFQFETTELPNGIPVHCLVLPDADQWHLGGVRTFTGLKDLRPSKKPGLDFLYNSVVRFDPKQRRNQDDYEPPRELPYDLSMRLRPCRFAYRAHGSPKNASKVAGSISGRLKNREFNKGRWSSALRFGEVNMTNIRERKRNAARAWRWGQLLGDDHPVIGTWAPDPETALGIKYNDLKKLHGKVAGNVGNTALVAAGPLDSQTVQNLLADSIGKKGERQAEWKAQRPDKKGTGPRGRVIPDLEKADVRLVVSIGLQPLVAAGDSLGTTVILLEEALRKKLTSRLREQEGLTYAVFCDAYPLGGLILWEVEVTCQPAQAPLALASLRDELTCLGRDGFTPDEWARARLGVTSRALVAFAEAEKGLDWMLRLATFGEIPADPMARIFDVELDRINSLAADILDMDNFVYTATGPLFEEDIDQF